MSDTSIESTPIDTGSRARRGWLPIAILGLVAGAAGFGPTYLGLWSPRDLVPARAASIAPRTGFVSLEPLAVSIPGPRERMVQVGIVLEIDEADRAAVEHAVPRLTDAATAFLGGIAPEAYDRRGILEIIRAELDTRARQILGADRIERLLLTEFVLK